MLSIGALFQLLLVSALPIFNMDRDERQSFLLLIALVAVSIGSATALRRWARAAVIALAIGSAYTTILIVWTAIVSSRDISAAPAHDHTEQILSLILALGTFATVPIALAFAWPLRQLAADTDPREALTTHSG
ncbi:MAG TPA: hypothetical protein VGJ12_08935 [Gemmatimonadaceae bacterium]